MRKIATYLSAIVLLTACITNNRQNNRILYVSIQPLQSLADNAVHKALQRLYRNV